MNPLQPDRAEEDLGVHFDDVIPTAGYRMLPLVGLGGSAGSIPALTTFFRLVRPDSGMAFVVVLHLHPDHESHLAELIQRVTTMPVRQVHGAEPVLADHVYVIPPGKSLSALDGELRLQALPSATGRHVAVDLFFRTLADTYGPHATAIVLSGLDGDGAIGIRRIKERGGLTIVQDPLEAEHSGMPRSAIATGLVDWVLPVAEMPARLVAYHRIESHLKLLGEEPPLQGAAAAAGPDPNEALLREVLELLRVGTGQDFSAYKRATILRRLGRRMQVIEVETLDAYLAYLRAHPGEARALLKDLLVSVTNFFRDADHFDALVPVLSRLFEGKRPDDAVRVWVVACATGEEAYSMAMLLHEHADRLHDPPHLRVFASDLDEDAIRVGRDGFYPLTIAADVSAERLERFFVREAGGYRVRPELRETVLFAVHNVLNDSPFSRIDAITCRNLLIYLDRAAQRRTMEIFHFALRADAILFLGVSESIDEASPLFGLIDKRHRIYVRRAAPRLTFPLPLGVTPAVPQSAAVTEGFEGETVAADAEATAEPKTDRSLARADMPDRVSRIHLRLMERFTLPSVVVDAQYQLVHVSTTAGRFLRLIGGEPSRDLLRLVQPSLRGGLGIALRRAAEIGAASEVLRVPAEIDGKPMLVDLSVAPADELAPQCLLVVFNAIAVGRQSEAPASGPAGDPREQELSEELTRMKAHLRDVIEQHEASTEELRASNEELQAMNEDLRSATEELEARRQEAQSMNEELAAISAEVKRTMLEVGATNRDLHNLMESLSIAMVFLDRDLRITFYTPMAVALFRLIPTDVGRPLADLVQRFDDPELLADARRVLEQLAPAEREVGAAQRWFLARVQPYRTLDERIAGVVLTFTDITERHRQQLVERQAARQLELRCAQLGAMLSALPVAVCVFDAQRRLAYANAAARRFWGLEQGEYVGRTLPKLGRRASFAATLDRHLERALETVSAGTERERGGAVPTSGTESGIAFGFAPIEADASAPRLMLAWLREAGAAAPRCGGFD